MQCTQLLQQSVKVWKLSQFYDDNKADRDKETGSLNLSTMKLPMDFLWSKGTVHEIH